MYKHIVSKMIPGYLGDSSYRLRVALFLFTGVLLLLQLRAGSIQQKSCSYCRSWEGSIFSVASQVQAYVRCSESFTGRMNYAIN